MERLKVLQQNLVEKEIKFLVTGVGWGGAGEGWGGGWREGELEEGCQKVQTSSYNKYK